jgi:protein-tyrosine sulfotransferase
LERRLAVRDLNHHMHSLTYIKNRLVSRLVIAQAKINERSIVGAHIGFQPIFIVSSGRAGTTILRKCLMNGGEIHIPPESGECIPRAFEKYVRGKSKSWPERVRLVVDTFIGSPDFNYWDINLDEDLDPLFRAPTPEQNFCSVIDHIYCSHASKKNPSAIRWGDKTPILSQSLDLLHACYPYAYYVNLVRDPRDVVISRMKAFNESLSVALNRWLVAYKCTEKWSGTGRLNLFTLKYEDLVALPETKLKELCKFTDLKYSPSMLGSHLDIDFGDTYLPHLKGTDQAIIRGGALTSRNTLSSHQLRAIEDATRIQRRILGYD